LIGRLEAIHPKLIMPDQSEEYRQQREAIERVFGAKCTELRARLRDWNRRSDAPMSSEVLRQTIHEFKDIDKEYHAAKLACIRDLNALTDVSIAPGQEPSSQTVTDDNLLTVVGRDAGVQARMLVVQLLRGFEKLYGGKRPPKKKPAKKKKSIKRLITTFSLDRISEKRSSVKQWLGDVRTYVTDYRRYVREKLISAGDAEEAVGDLRDFMLNGQGVFRPTREIVGKGLAIVRRATDRSRVHFVSCHQDVC
jgi:hypothetical protein